MAGSKSKTKGKVNYDQLADVKRNARFKGVENFLRRVAFNLGNTPSQTEVKIISCIPVDVTDLQQKIIVLEKQLAESKMNNKRATDVNTVSVCPCSVSNDKASACCSKTRKSSVSFDCPTDPDYCTSDYEETRRAEKLLKRNKKKYRSPAVYYAQVSNSPFKKSSKIIYPKTVTTKKIPRKCSRGISRSYIENMIKKQYKTHHISNLSVEENFTKPICHDINVSYHQIINQDCTPTYFCDYGINDDLRAEFINIDNNSFATKHCIKPRVTSEHKEATDSGNIYHNSSLYDIVPVKERPKKNAQKSKMEKVLNKMSSSKYISPIAHDIDIPNLEINRNKFRNKYLSIDCTVDCSNVYKKQSKTPSQFADVSKHRENRSIFKSCAECQTADEQASSIITTGNKTEETLSQIKNILKNVLLEVKTTQVKAEPEKINNPEVPVKKNSNTNNLNVAQSFNGPQNMGSCSRNMSAGPFYQYGFPYPGIGYPQTFPVIIQSASQGRPIFTSCHQHCPCKKQDQTKNETTASPNEDVKEQPKSETEKLIKEIYKSINILNKDTTCANTQNESFKSSLNYSVNTAAINPSNLEGNIQETLCDILSTNENTKKTEISLKGNEDIANASHLEKVDLDQIRKKNYEEFVKNNTGLAEEHNKLKNDSTSKELNANILTERTVQDDEERCEVSADDMDTDENTEASESDDDVDNVSRAHYGHKEKKSVFHKVLGSLFRSKNKKQKSEPESAAYEETLDEDSDNSDSDEYQTIYSEQVEKKPRGIFFKSMPKGQQPKYILTKNVHYKEHPSRKPQLLRKPSRLSYTQQNLRSQWDKNVYQGRQQYYQSPPTSQVLYPPHHYQHPMYWQTYEARNAFVDYKTHPASTFMAHGGVQTNTQTKPTVTKNITSNPGKLEPFFKPKWNLFNKPNSELKPKQGWKKFFLES